MIEPLISLEQVRLGYDRPLLGPFDLDIAPGQFWGMVGPNGAGKTTLARTLLGLIPPYSGTVTVHKPGLRFGYVPQRHTLDQDYPLTALDVTLMGRTDHFGWLRGPRAEDERVALAELERLGARDLAPRAFRDLSGGQKQRVLTARALASEPDVLVLDEPTEGIDLSGQADLMAFLENLHQTVGLPIVMIEHHMSEVLSIVDHLCLINHRTGLFEAGALGTLLTEDRLSQLYGRSVEIDSCGESIHVHVRKGDGHA